MQSKSTKKESRRRDAANAPAERLGWNGFEARKKDGSVLDQKVVGQAVFKAGQAFARARGIPLGM